MEAALDHYNHLLSKGYLLELFPDLTGEWEQDKKEFIVQYNKNQELLNEDLTVDDEDEDFYADDY